MMIDKRKLFNSLITLALSIPWIAYVVTDLIKNQRDISYLYITALIPLFFFYLIPKLLFNKNSKERRMKEKAFEHGRGDNVDYSKKLIKDEENKISKYFERKGF